MPLSKINLDDGRNVKIIRRIRFKRKKNESGRLSYANSSRVAENQTRQCTRTRARENCRCHKKVTKRRRWTKNKSELYIKAYYIKKMALILSIN